MTVSLSPDLFVSDLERSVAFYKKALGLEEVDRAAGPEGAFFAMMSREGFRIMMESPKSPGTQELQRRHGATPRATILLYLFVDDPSAEERRLQAAGVTYHGPVTQPYGMKEVSFEDPGRLRLGDRAEGGVGKSRWMSGKIGSRIWHPPVFRRQR